MISSALRRFFAEGGTLLVVGRAGVPGGRAGSANWNSHSHRIRTNNLLAIRIRIAFAHQIAFAFFDFYMIWNPKFIIF
jgi:hypothetical protein